MNVLASAQLNLLDPSLNDNERKVREEAIMLTTIKNAILREGITCFH